MSKRIIVLLTALGLLLAHTAYAQSEDIVSVGDYTIILPDLGLDWLIPESPSLEGTLAGSYTDEGQEIIYQATVTSRLGRSLTLTILSREHASSHFQLQDFTEFSLLGYAFLEEELNGTLQSLLWIDYIDPVHDRHLVVIIEGHPRLFNIFDDELFRSALSLRSAVYRVPPGFFTTSQSHFAAVLVSLGSQKRSQHTLLPPPSPPP